jgi:uncharacterized phage-associated protein
MAQNAVAVANYFVQKSINEQKPISPMKVQKLVYIAHGWHLAVTEEPLIDDKVGAWPFGPVIGSIYKAFSQYARRAIDRVIDGNDLVSPSEDTITILDTVWEKYKNFSATELSNMTHQEGSPWQITYEKGRSNIIDNELIKCHYKERLA